jgi:Sulfatase
VLTIAALLMTIVWAASVKRETMNMVVHAYDLFFYLNSWSTFSFLWHEQRRLVLLLVAALSASAAIGVLAWKRDATRIARPLSLAACGLAIGLAYMGAAYKGERRHMQFNFQALYLSSFFASWGETLETLWRGSMLEASSRGLRPETLLRPLSDCTTREKPPHIVLIHQESLVPPSIFPTLKYDTAVDPMFRSQDGRVHKMRVETYGGASWLTEFSILAGLSTQAFGGMRQFVQTFLVNKLSDTLPQNLERCGYRNVMFYPMLKNFVSNDKFYNSIGLKEIFDLKAQGAKTANERDKFYYTNAIAEMERHVASSDKPMFTYIQTMSAHWPYDITFEPKENVAGGAPGAHPELHEYLRRVSLAKMDYDFLLAELKRRLPDERILIVHYGDHQPTATRMLLGFKEDTEAEDVALKQESQGFLTYFAVDGINYEVPPLPPEDIVDVPYLGLIVQQSAGLPLSDAHKERQRLLTLCHGRNYGCSEQKAILAFHRRLIDSGIIVAR